MLLAKPLAAKDMDFNLKVAMILMHYSVARQRYKDAYSQLKNYENSECLS